MLEESTTMWVEVWVCLFVFWFGLGLAVYTWTFLCLSWMLDRKTDGWTDGQTDRQVHQSKQGCTTIQVAPVGFLFFPLKLIGQSQQELHILAVFQGCGQLQIRLPVG